MVRITCLFSVISVFILMPLSHAEMYKWVDENGKVHFSDRPQPNAKSIDIQAPKPSGIGVSKNRLERQQRVLEDLERRRLKREKSEAKAQQKREARERYCVRLKNRLRNYEDVDYLFTRDTQGNKKRLSSERKRQEQQKLRDQIAEQC